MKSEQEQVSKVVEKVAENVKGEVSQDHDKIASKIVKQGILPKDALGLDDQMLEGIYGQAYRLYNTGKYREAGQLFRLLIMINSMDPKYSMGLAACFHMLKEYKNAADAYTLCSIIDPTNPLPHYHASDCYIQMDDRISAIVALEMSISRAEGRAEFHTLVDRAKMSIQSLKKEVKKELQK